MNLLFSLLLLAQGDTTAADWQAAGVEGYGY